MNKLMTSPTGSGHCGDLLPPLVRLAGADDRLTAAAAAGIMHHRDKKKCDVVDFGGGGVGGGGVTSSLYALTHDVIGFGGGCGGGGGSSMSLSTAVAAAGGVSSSIAPPRGLGLADNTGSVDDFTFSCIHTPSTGLSLFLTASAGISWAVFLHVWHCYRPVLYRNGSTDRSSRCFFA